MRTLDTLAPTLDPPHRAGAPPQVLPPLIDVDERDARRTLRTQIARLEGQLADAVVTDETWTAIEAPRRRSDGPHLSSLGELERARDQLSERLADARGSLAHRGEAHTANRRLLEAMMLDPGRHRFVRISREDLGERGCGGWEVRPRLGVIGMLAGWWHVVVSSGCPLAT